MSKQVKKPKRRMKKQVRKTIAGLLLTSAIVVAALPVQETQANVDVAELNKVVVTSGHPVNSNYATGTKTYDSCVPFVADLGTGREDEKTVYNSEDGLFQFVYIRPTATDPNRVAMILNYTGSETSLTIPDTLEGYKKYDDNVTSSGYCLVSKKGEFLHYLDRKQKEEAGEKYYLVTDIMVGEDKMEVKESQCQYREVEGVLKLVYVKTVSVPAVPTPFPTPTPDPGTGIAPDPDPAPTPYNEYVDEIHEIEPEMEIVYMPCYNTTKDKWKDIPDAELYYSNDAKNVFTLCSNVSDHQKIVADVAFIGQEKLTSDSNNNWVVGGPITSPDEGVFAHNPSLTYLTIGNNIRGIGDFAFYGCSTLQSLQFSAKLQTVGNGAFAECIRLQNCDIAYNSNLLALGKDAFFNCRSLNTFYTNVGLEAIGDSCFEGCNALTTVYLSGENAPGGAGEVALRYIGNHAFMNCLNLAALEFPYTYGESDYLDPDIFKGCSSLQFVKISNDKIKFKEIHKDSVTDYPRCGANTWKEVLGTLPDSFYFEGPDVSPIHDTCKEESIAFKYLNSSPELFEMIMYEQDKGDTLPSKTAKITYQIHTDGSIYKVIIEKDPINLTIPETIGPYGINTIGPGAFSDNCSLNRLTIPASCTVIEDNAFKGCHNLKTVIFTDASKVQNIGIDAFKTQDCMHTGTGAGMKCSQCNGALAHPSNPSLSDISLTFVGKMIDQGSNQDTVPFVYAMNGQSNINNSDQPLSWITCHSGWPTNMEVRYNYDGVSGLGEILLVGYPRYEVVKNDSASFVHNLPYVTPENESDYYGRVSQAVNHYESYIYDPTQPQPSEEEYSVINASLNVVVPSIVDGIEEGLFSGAKIEDGGTIAGKTPDDKIKTVVLNGVNEVDPYTFKGCTGLKEVDVIKANAIDDYAFYGCTGLQRAELGPNITEIGKRPFIGCSTMTDVIPLGSNTDFNNGLLFLTTNGRVLAECLPGRGNVVGSYMVSPAEMDGCTGIAEEAFMDCDGIGQIDLRSSSVEEIPKKACADMNNLVSVFLPNTLSSIEVASFQDTPALRMVQIPSSVSNLEPEAFHFTTGGTVTDRAQTGHQRITVQCVENSRADKYAKMSDNWYMNPEYGEVFLTHLVYFYDRNPENPTSVSLLDKQIVNDGKDAVPPSDPTPIEGYEFTGWTPYQNIVKDTDVYANYVKKGDPVYDVVFFDSIEGVQIGETQHIQQGKSAVPPTAPTHEGYTFIGWTKDYNNVNEDLTIITKYKDNSSTDGRHTVRFVYFDGTTMKTVSTQSVAHESAATTPASPSREGYTFVGWEPSDYSSVTEDMVCTAVFTKNSSSGKNDSGGGGGGSDSKPSASPKSDGSGSSGSSGSQDNVKKYTVSVSGGSGSGTYPAGAIVVINAYDMGTGKDFDKWTSSTAGVGFANPNSASTTFTMPAANVAITATYKTGAASGNGNSSGGGNGQGGGNGTGTRPSNTGTQVEVTKPGISNTNLAGATVNGSTDDFIIKVTEDPASTNLIIAALQARYGDISAIKYLPMDISLYDSSGRTKIADTQGLSVNITIPIPDELRQYAGNNKVAAITNGALEDLAVRYTTIDGVPCLNFTAPHLSPYVIYVDTANLTAATIDDSPKTGDGIHPKWFLAIGLAALSMILFFKKDKRVGKARPA